MRHENVRNSYTLQWKKSVRPAHLEKLRRGVGEAPLAHLEEHVKGSVSMYVNRKLVNAIAACTEFLCMPTQSWLERTVMCSPQSSCMCPQEASWTGALKKKISTTNLVQKCMKTYVSIRAIG
jgi:hypothetical protein